MAFLLTFAVALVAALTLSGNAMAEAGVQCAPTGMESVSTPRDHYQAGEVATISGDGYAIACDVKVDVERPDGVVESFTATTDMGGDFTLDYQVPPPPGVVGRYTVVVRGLDGAELASVTFEDAPAPQFDIAPAHVAATGTHVFSALLRNTANSSSDTARCVRITTPASVTVTSATSVVASPSTTGPWNLTTGANFVELRTDTNSRAGIFGSSNNWVRFEITANATSTGSATWTSRMVTSNASCPSGGSTDQLAVRVGGTFTRDYTADFRDASNNVIAAPTVLQGQSQQYRIRITRAAGGDDLSYAAVALPTCLTNITSMSTTNSAGPSAPDFVAQLTDNYFRFVTTGDKLAQNGQWAQVQFTATATCSLGSYVFRTASWKNTSPETSQDDIFKLQTATGQPTLTVISPNVAPTVAENDATVTVDEGETAANTGIWGDANPTDTVTLSASVGTVVKSGANAAGTWSWSYPTTDGAEQTQTVTITANDGTTATSTTFQLDVNNVAPSAIFNAPASVEESSSIGLSLTDPSDPSSADTAAGFEYRFSCDDGTTWTPWSASSAHVCATNDDGTRNVKGELRDKDGGTSTDSASVTVENVAPSATFSAPEAVDEGSDIDVSLTDVVDPGNADTHEYRFSCDGGTTWTAWGDNTHACATTDNGTVVVTGQIRDDDGGASPIYEAAVTVTNVVPSATFDAPEAVNEGSDINLSLSDVVDPGNADTHEYRFSCDGGTTWTPYGNSAGHSCVTDDNGTKSVTGQIRDDDGDASPVYEANVAVDNVAPSATFNAPESFDEGSNISLSLTDADDPSSADSAAGFDYRFSCDDGATWTAWSSSNAHACPTDDDGTKNVEGQIRDKDGGTSTHSASVSVDNVAPTATFDAPDSVSEGSNISLSLTSPSDPSSADTAAGFQYAFDCGDGSGYGAYSAVHNRSCATSDNGTADVRGKIRDKDGGVTEYMAAVTVDNVAPTLHTLTANSYAVPMGTAVTVTGSYSDPGSADTFSCVVAWDDGSANTEINRPSGSTHCETGKAFTQQGVYSISMYVNDDDGGTSNTLTIVLAVYDPSAGGFVTGGGWINSPAGSYAADPAASGRANFGFNSQYKKGATVPTGQTEFQLHFASFNFHSDAYQWLVVSGHKAQYRGTGKVNGVPGYGFVLTAYDGNVSGGGGVDKFRIKIWRQSDGAVVYDTKMGTSDDIDQANPLAIAGGSIVIHKSK